MPKVTLTYNLPDEKFDYDCARSGVAFYNMLDDIRNLMRRYRKYSDFADPEWYRKPNRQNAFPIIKERFQKLADARASFFDKLDAELREIILNAPEVD